MSEIPDISLPKLSYGFARQYGVIVTELDGEAVLLRRVGASLGAAIEARRIADRVLRIEALSVTEFEAQLSHIYAQGDLDEAAATVIKDPEDLTALVDSLPRTADLLDSDDNAPIIRLINGILQQAIKARASDIHVEPFENYLTIRFRIDGALRDILSLPQRLSAVLVSRIKVMARLDIANKRIPQDGRFSLNLSARSIDIRVSTLPSQYGERAVMRILERTHSIRNMGELGMNTGDLSAFQSTLKNPNGIILVTGPTGSGKTTTLYAAISQLNNGSNNILTVEDPVEYALDGVGQTQVNPQTGMNFATGLRAILRQDPDIVMVGEIRDPETAEIAVQAALTGHLVLSTVHTNSAIGAITRLRDMGIESFLLASTVSAIVAQRLVRRLCPECKIPFTPSPSQLEELQLKPDIEAVFYRAEGCSACHNIGYAGRLGLYEVVAFDDTLRSMLHEQSSELAMADYAFKGTQTLLQSGAAHILSGATSYDEVLRVCWTNGQEG